MSQKDKILQYMLEQPGRRISTWIAYEYWHCTTLAQRIADLRKEEIVENGILYKICDELVYKQGKNFSEYWLEPVEVYQEEFQFQE